MAISQADRSLVTVSSMPGPWAMISGQEVSREVTTVRERAGGPDVPLPSRIQHPDVSLQRAYDPERDSALFKAIASGNAYPGTSISVDTLDLDGNVIPGSKVTYTNCTVVSASLPDGDANSSDTSMLTVVFKVGAVA